MSCGRKSLRVDGSLRSFFNHIRHIRMERFAQKNALLILSTLREPQGKQAQCKHKVRKILLGEVIV